MLTIMTIGVYGCDIGAFLEGLREANVRLLLECAGAGVSRDPSTPGPTRSGSRPPSPR